MQKVLMLKGEFVDKIRGGTRLRDDFGYDITSDSVGEYRAISAMDDAPSVITNGKLKGKSLNEVYRENRELFGKNTEDTFPLLVKIIDAKDDLSIQVHPDDEMAKELENSRGKTECRYILNNNESSIIFGLNSKTKEEAMKLIKDGKWKEVLNEVPVKEGDFFFVPAGTVHAIKKGCLILEIQQASDVTYRLYDYDRIDKDGNLRKLHIEKSLKAIKINEDINTIKQEHESNFTKTTLTNNEFFEVYENVFDGSRKFKRNKDYLLESVIDGSGILRIGSEEYEIKKGDFFIITNAAKSYELDGFMTIIESSPKA